MKITVLNGSPKGDQSVTMQYVHFIQKKYPQHELKIINIAQHIKKLEENEQAFQEVLDAVRSSDGVLWAFPLYYYLAHAHYKRFIELLWERSAQDAFQGKYAAALTTSIHFYDHTAHNYVHAICDDLDMRFVDGYSAAMHDLFAEAERQKCLQFAAHFFETIEQQRATFKHFQPIAPQPWTYAPGQKSTPTDLRGKKVVLITDENDPQTNLGKMIARVRQAFAQEITVIDLSALDIKSSCLGCLQCGYDNTCVWEGKDDYIACFKTHIQPADVVLFAGTMRDRYLSARWKMFFDRSFFMTHIPSLSGKQFGWIVSGALRQNANLREIMEAYTEAQGSHLVDIITDEGTDAAELDARLDQLAAQAIRFAEQGYQKPATYLSIGGKKIFRDEVWGPMRAVFHADHVYYKQHGRYDFPQYDYKTRAINLIVPLLLKIPAFRKRVYTQEMKPGMIRGLQKVVAQA